MWEAEKVFKALGDPTRRDIVKLLRRGPRTSGDIAEQFSTAWATISRHLAVLKDAGIITAERNGNSITYTLNATVIQELIEHLYDWTSKGDDHA
ncbi:MAG TPA: autorepressor SdpR family transcription factor [Gemmatimonadaceae bacterium]|nr:autorepressor SdpR family transcription factor [Gemmatimonadaceae bacterium]